MHVFDDLQNTLLNVCTECLNKHKQQSRSAYDIILQRSQKLAPLTRSDIQHYALRRKSSHIPQLPCSTTFAITLIYCMRELLFSCSHCIMMIHSVLTPAELSCLCGHIHFQRRIAPARNRTVPSTCTKFENTKHKVHYKRRISASCHGATHLFVRMLTHSTRTSPRCTNTSKM